MERVALVVGINCYPFVEDLKTAARDAEAIAQCLEQPTGNLAWSVKRLPAVAQDGKFSVAEAEQVDATQLENEILKLLHPEPKYVPKVALFFFAGHGLRQQQEKKTEGFLATSDADDNQLGISLNWLRQQLLTSPVKQQIVWLDCCHSGELLNFLSPEELRDWLSGGDRLLMAACRGDREAYAFGEHGVLTEVLLQGLDPNQHPSGELISSWTLTRFVRQQLDKNPNLKLQVPLFRHFGEEIEFWQGTKQLQEQATKPTPIFDNFVSAIFQKYRYLENLPPRIADQKWKFVNSASEEELTDIESKVLKLVISYCCYFVHGFPTPDSVYGDKHRGDYYELMLSFVKKGKVTCKDIKLSAIVKDAKLASIIGSMER